jgi:hypothetical protein
MDALSRTDSEKLKQMTAYNLRFCVMAAVTPRKMLCVIERLSPAITVVEAATTQSRWDVICKRRERGRQRRKRL